MPVIATPLPVLPTPPNNCPTVTEGCCGQAPPCDNTTTAAVNGCQGLRVINAPISNVNGQPVLSRARAVKLMQNQQADVEWIFQDEYSRPIDLSDCTHDLAVSLGSLGPHDEGEAGDFKFVFKLYEQLGAGACVRELDVTVTDSAIGKVLIHFDSEDTTHPGVYFGELQLVQADSTERLLHANIFYVHIQRGAQAIMEGAAGPPSIAEIRLFLRDSGSAENFLLDNIKFDDAEIAYAITTPIEYWNEIPPMLNVQATTTNFPFRHHWMRAIAATLFRIAAENFRSNNLTYSAAGVSIDDQNKEPNYERAAADHWKAWTEFVRLKKYAMNAESFYAEISSPYSGLY